MSIQNFIVSEQREETPDVLVNLWEDVGGQMKLKDQKPLQRSQFDTTERLQDFSYFTNDALNYL